jgi:peptide chain release factor 2
MKEYLENLKKLEEKIKKVWSLLDIDKMIVESRGMESEMQSTDFWNDQENAKKTAKNYEDIKSEIEKWTNIKKEVSELISLGKDLEKTPDKSIEADFVKRVEELQKQFSELEFYMLLDGVHDKKNAIVAIHAGSGGTEAQDWAEMLLRMLMRYCEKKGWSIHIIDESKGGETGIKSTVFRVEGRYAYGHLKSEHGTHRLVRISPFDAEKMRHTSFALVEVVPEIENREDYEIDPKDLRVDTFMSGGHGGQSVNTTYSAIRIVHKPTGIVVQCQNERSQQQNRETALKILASKLQKLKEEKEREEKQELKGEHKSAEWGNQIRSYVLHPYKMVKDLRSKYETQDPEKVLNGDLDELVEAHLRFIKTQQ